VQRIFLKIPVESLYLNTHLCDLRHISLISWRDDCFLICQINGICQAKWPFLFSDTDRNVNWVGKWNMILKIFGKMKFLLSHVDIWILGNLSDTFLWDANKRFFFESCSDMNIIKSLMHVLFTCIAEWQ
jgi:hypothetical protein